MADEKELNPEVVDDSNGKKKEKKPKSKARKIIEWVLLGIFLLAAGAFGAGQIDGMIHKSEYYGQTISFGFGSFVILTDSMEPDYMTVKISITSIRNTMNSLKQKKL